MKNTALHCASVVMLVLLLLFSPSASFAKNSKITILSSGNSLVYKQIIDTIRNTVNKNKEKHVAFEVAYVDEITSIKNDKINNADLLLTIGRRAMQNILQREKSPPILTTLIPHQLFEQNLPALKAINNNVAAVYIDSPPERQILLAKILLGNVQTIGILLSDKPPTSKQKIISISNRAKIRVHIEAVSAGDNIIRKLSHALTVSDVLLALPDPLIFNSNTARDILLTTYRKRIPVIGFSASYVKAGALAATFSSSKQIAVQTGETILDILRTKSPFPLGGKYPKYFDVAVNPDVARSLGINVPPKQKLKNELQKLLAEHK